MSFIILVITSKTHIHEGQIHIDRVDLTRKLDAINTWVEDILNSGNDVIFVDGDNDKEWYDENSKTLHLVECDDYHNIFNKGKTALKWVYNNREFDFVYSCDDDIFINVKQFLKLKIEHDYVGTGSFGGGGMFWNKKSIETLLNYEKPNNMVADIAIYNAISSDSSITKNFSNNKSSVFYFPGELYATIHYVAGKRTHYLYNVFNYFNENGYTNRKILLGGPINTMLENKIVSYESFYKRITKRWYDFTTDCNGWEYHGGYIRSSITIDNLINFWPYAENATKFFVINYKNLLAPYLEGPKFQIYLDYLINQCEKSLINKNNLLLCTDTVEEIDGWVLDNSVKEKYKLNFELLNVYNFYKKIN